MIGMEASAESASWVKAHADVLQVARERAGLEGREGAPSSLGTCCASRWSVLVLVVAPPRQPLAAARVIAAAPPT